MTSCFDRTSASRERTYGGACILETLVVSSSPTPTQTKSKSSASSSRPPRRHLPGALLRRGEDRIHFRVVDEYWDEGATYRVSPGDFGPTSTLAELIDLIDTSEREEEAHPGGLVTHLEYLLHEEAWIEGPTEVAFFATVTSAFYPMLNEYFLARAEAWLAEVKRNDRPSAKTRSMSGSRTTGSSSTGSPSPHSDEPRE